MPTLFSRLTAALRLTTEITVRQREWHIRHHDYAGYVEDQGTRQWLHTTVRFCGVALFSFSHGPVEECDTNIFIHRGCYGSSPQRASDQRYQITQTEMRFRRLTGMDTTEVFC